MLRILDHLEEWLITLLIGAATLLIFTAVLHRYSMDLSNAWGWDAVYDWLFRINLSWAQELCIYMFVWMAKFGAAYGVRTGIHVGVDVLINNLHEGLRSKFVLFGLLAGALFTGLVGSFGVNFVWHLSHTDATSPDLELPVWIVYLAIPLGSYLMCFRFLEVAWSFFRTGELPRHEHAYVEGLEEEVEQAQAAGRQEPVYLGEAITLAEEREHMHGGHLEHHPPGGTHEPDEGGPRKGGEDRS
ncbi:MAG: TRAP transporter small permease [Lamprocystis purpurea]|jgi:C4-dicarboxylate transporter DctQ subunit|uniref:TRAP transporter small permease n=1 Tax=Lamprocystis purpurea TaxID=61598 RepID=UPI000375E8DB|nr:TRAP transporter small permease [Lamprocystis purpurea]MBV5274763.1 TRAP transporter small permease [Lamprocystis purpurea]